MSAHLLRISALLILATWLRAEDIPSSADADLPQQLDSSMADQLLTHSPFTRIVNLEDTLQLTGVAYVDGRPVATFLNKATKEHITVSEEPNAQGWKITEATPGVVPEDTEVHVMIGSEEITMRYGDAQITPGTTKNGNPGVYVERGPGQGTPHSSDRIKTSSLLGQNGKELYTSLSREARDKLKEIVHAHMDKHPEYSMEQNSAYAQKVYAKIKAADVKNGGNSSSGPSARSQKSPKPGKTR